MSEVKIRAATSEDYPATEFVIREAFWNVFKPGTDVHWATHFVREWDSYIPQLDFVALDGEKIVGNVVSRKAAIVGDDGITYVTVRLGPLAVLPKYQRQGIGRQLIEKTVETAREMKFRSIMLLGDPEYYLKRGFKPAEAFGIRNAKNFYIERLHAFELYEGALVSGRYLNQSKYKFDAEQFKIFDGKFPDKELLTDTPSQLRLKQLKTMKRRAERR